MPPQNPHFQNIVDIFSSDLSLADFTPNHDSFLSSASSSDREDEEAKKILDIFVRATLIDLSSEDDSLLSISCADMEEEEEKHEEAKTSRDIFTSLSLIDLSSEDDSLLSSSFSVLQAEEANKIMDVFVGLPLIDLCSEDDSLLCPASSNSLWNKKTSGSGSNEKSAAFSKKYISISIYSPKSSSSSSSSYFGSSCYTKTLPKTPALLNKSGGSKTLRNRTQSIFKTPLRFLRDEAESSNYLVSNSKFSHTSPPPSSVNGFSMELSCSTRNARQMSRGSRTVVGISPTSSCLGGGLFARNITPESPDETLVEHSVEGLPSRGVEKGHEETSVISRPAEANSRVQNSKPSCLRMPSQRIGFFDMENAGLHTSSATLKFQSRLKSGLLKNAYGIGSIDRAIDQRHNKLKHTRPTPKISTIKFNSPLVEQRSYQASSTFSMKSTSTQQLISPSRTPSATLRMKNHSKPALAVQKSSRKLQAEVFDKEKHGWGSDHHHNVEEHENRNKIKKYNKGLKSAPLGEIVSCLIGQYGLGPATSVLSEKENISESNRNCLLLPRQLISVH